MLQTKLLTETATLPTRGSAQAAGLDMYFDLQGQMPGMNVVGVSFTVEPGERAVLKTGVSMAIPDGFYGQIAPRSGLAVKQGLEILAGVIDSDYRGEIMIAVLNSGSEPIQFKKGDRVAQMLILPVSNIVPEQVEELVDTDRGDGKFGSTGK